MKVRLGAEVFTVTVNNCPSRKGFADIPRTGAAAFSRASLVYRQAHMQQCRAGLGGGVRYTNLCCNGRDNIRMSGHIVMGASSADHMSANDRRESMQFGIRSAHLEMCVQIANARGCVFVAP